MRHLCQASEIWRIGAIALIVFTAFPAAASDCVRPTIAPTIPNGVTATMDQLKATHLAVQDYVTKLLGYRDCVEAEIKAAPKGSKSDALQKLRDSGATAVADAKSLSDSYVLQVTVFKAQPRNARP